MDRMVIGNMKIHFKIIVSIIILFVFSSCTLLGCASAASDSVLNDEESDVLSTDVTDEGANVGDNLSDAEDDVPDISEGTDYWDLIEAGKVEEQIREAYEESLEAEYAAKILAATMLQDAQYVSFDEEERSGFGELIIDQAIDEMSGNDIVSSGVKAMIESAAKEKSFDEIIQSATDAAINEIPDYVEGKLEGSITDLVGVDVFNAAEWISEYANASDIPVALINGIVSEQQEDVSKLLAFIEQDTLGAGEIQYMWAILNRIGDRQREILDAGGDAKILGRSNRLEEYAEIRAEDYYRILQLQQLMEAIEEHSLQPNDITQYSEDLKTNLESDSDLYNLNITGLPVNYDVESYRQSQKYSEQSGMLGSLFLGDILGTVVQDETADNENEVQENRIAFYRSLSNSLEESYLKVAETKAAFKGCYHFYQNIIEESAEESQDYNAMLCFISGQENNDAPWKAEKEAYLNALAQYTFDLSCIYLMYDNTLTENEDRFLSAMKSDIENQMRILELYGWSVENGYSEEEMESRYLQIIDEYRHAMYVMTNLINSEPGLISESSVTAYGVGTLRAFSNKGSIVLIQETNNDNFMQEPEMRLYDRTGNPIYIEVHQGKVILMDNRIISFTAAAEYMQTDEWAEKLVEESRRIWNEYKTAEFSHNYQNYAM